MTIDYGRFDRSRYDSNINTQTARLTTSMQKTNNIIGATEVEVLEPNGNIKIGIINTLNRKEILATTITDFRYFFTVPPLVLNHGDIILNWENEDWIIINAQNTGEVVYQGYSCKCIDIHFGKTIIRGAYSRFRISADKGEFVELSDGQIDIFIPQNENTLDLVKQNALFTIDGFGYEIHTRPNKNSAEGLITARCRDYVNTDIETPIAPTPESENFSLGWAKEFTSSIPTKWQIITDLKYIVNEETLNKLVVTIPVQKNWMGKSIKIINSEKTYTLYVE